jgi:hypothetical protein
MMVIYLVAEDDEGNYETVSFHYTKYDPRIEPCMPSESYWIVPGSEIED